MELHGEKNFYLQIVRIGKETQFFVAALFCCKGLEALYKTVNNLLRRLSAKIPKKFPERLDKAWGECYN